MIRRTLIGLTTVSALALTAAVPSFAADPQPGETLAEDQVFRYRLAAQFPTLDPQLNEETEGFHVIRQLFEGLMNQDSEGNLVPGVAESFEASEGNTVYTFTLREDARWSNGDPVTASDFVYGWRRAADPATASPYQWYVELTQIENAAAVVAGDMEPDALGVEAVDDRTLRVTLEAPLPYFPAMTTYGVLFPAHESTIEAHGDDWTDVENIVSNGAYTLESLSLNEGFTLVKNDQYWDADSVEIERIEGYVIVDDNQALTRYEAGEFDMLEPVPAGTFPRLQEERPDEANSVPRLCSYYYPFNFRAGDDVPEALSDPNVRYALSLAVDRDVIVDQILQGGQEAAYNFTHWATAGFEQPTMPMQEMTQAERDAEAQRLWEEAGSPDLDLRFIYNTSDQHRQIATVVSQMWKQKLGVDTTLSNSEWAVYLEQRREGGFDLARSAWCGDYNEASTFLDLMTTTHGSNDGKYSNERLDQLMAESKTSENPQEIYTEVEQIIYDDTAMIPIYHYALTFLLNPEIKGWPLENVENNWYVKDFYRTASE
ncbi:peptide ABC transporter substrate-binding protein [Jannaschia sp. LMIT008]|uniref:peptide ABC transporter substrate-binding protein n=1 Tax=Jannaschia maritima TaxID=3032585 RepID=UPI0028111185|nr:peptide ABC transporter substrate-binding protein [Jannaschia sp. LMIT008]